MKRYESIGSLVHRVLFEGRQGQGLSEYALILGLVVVLMVAALGWVQGGIEGLFSDILTIWP